MEYFFHPNNLPFILENKLNRVDLSRVDFQKLKEKGYSFNYLNFDNCIFRENQNLSFLNFNGSSFRGIIGERLDFENSFLKDCDFTGASLCGSNFRKSKLSNSCFVHADLRNSILFSWKGANIDFSYADLVGARFYPQLNQTGEYRKFGRNKIKGIKLNGLPFEYFFIPENLLSVDANEASLVSRCSQAETFFEDFCKKKICFRYNSVTIDFLVNINEEENNKFSLFTNKNILLPKGKLWKHCFYTLRNKNLREKIIDFCICREEYFKMFDLNEEGYTELAFVRPIDLGKVCFSHTNFSFSEDISNFLYNS